MVFASVSSTFDSLPTRPPTPPRDVSRDIDRDIDDALSFLDDSFETERIGVSVQPPVSSQSLADQTPPPSTEHKSGSGKRIKRVDFSPWNNYHKPTDKHSSPLRPLPQSRTCKPLKSILKPADSPTHLQVDFTSTPLCSSLEFGSFPEMLEVAVQQLASESKDARLDAYSCLNNVLKAFEDISGIEALRTKTTFLTQFIQRDMTALNSATNGPDSALASQAIKLALSLLRIPLVAAAMKDDFRVFLVERSISALTDESTPKAIVNHHMYFLAQQKFSSKIMNPFRIEKIVDCLKDIHNMVKGNNIIGYRLLVYRTLVQQAPTIMAAKISAWFEHVFHGMLSSVKETRSNAIELGLSAGVKLGGNRQASKIVMELLNKEVEPDKTYAAFMALRLEKMLSKKEEAQHAPRIWSVVVLFLKGRKQKPDGWRHFKTWLTLFNRFVNATDPSVKIQTHLAWNRFVYILQPDDQTSAAMVSLLQTVVRTQLDLRTGNDKSQNTVRQTALASYYNLLYYALRPSSSTESLDTYWNAFVLKLLEPVVEASTDGARLVCRILTVLFGGSSTRIWNENKAVEPEAMQIEDLPHLDPKWIRQRLRSILPLVQKCIETSPWDSADTPSCAMSSMWISLMHAIGEAGRKEVTVSMELKEAIAHIMNLLRRTWSAVPAPSTDGSSFQLWSERFAFLVTSAMEQLGVLHFTDKILSRTNEADFEAAPTPSHRSKTSRQFQSPLLHVLDLILNQPCDASNTNGLVSLMRQLLLPSLASRTSRQSKLDLLRDCVSAILESGTSATASQLWQLIAELALAVLKDGEANSEHRSRPLRHDYEDLRLILTGGLRFEDSQAQKAAEQLFVELTSVITREAGSASVILALAEPLSTLISAELNTIPLLSALSFASLILSNLPHPKNRKVIEHAHKTLLDASFTPSKVVEFDPYQSLYGMALNVSSRAYTSFSGLSFDAHCGFLSALCSSVHSCPFPLAGLYLKNMQGAIAIWLEDKARILKVVSPGEPSIYTEVLQLCQAAINVLSMFPQKDTQTLRTFDVLLSSAFTSSRKGIANVAIEFWNASFGSASDLEYPPRTENALRRLQRSTELQLPNFPAGAPKEKVLPLCFIDSQEDADRGAEKIRPRRGDFLIDPDSTPSRNTRRATARRSMSRSGSQPRVTRSRPDGTPKMAVSSPLKKEIRTSSRKKTPKRRLRHDDSQIEFESIDSKSPSKNAPESQNLTEHQIEVNERQHQEVAAVFPDINSTPSRAPLETHDITTDSDILSTRRRSRRVNGRTAPRPWTPSSKIGPMDYFVGSSPTPAQDAQRRSYPLDISAADPPSSPPRSVYDSDPAPAEREIAEVDDDMPFEHLDEGEETTQEDLTVEMGRAAPEEPEATANEEYTIKDRSLVQDADSLTSDDGSGSDIDLQLSAQIETEVDAYNAKSETNPATRNQGDLFVDAPSEPVESANAEDTDVFVDASPHPIRDTKTAVKAARSEPPSPIRKHDGKRARSARDLSSADGALNQRGHCVADSFIQKSPQKTQENDAQASMTSTAGEVPSDSTPRSKKRKNRSKKSDGVRTKRVRSSPSGEAKEVAAKEAAVASPTPTDERNSDIKAARSRTDLAFEQVLQKRKRGIAEMEAEPDSARRPLGLLRQSSSFSQDASPVRNAVHAAKKARAPPEADGTREESNTTSMEQPTENQNAQVLMPGTDLPEALTSRVGEAEQGPSDDVASAAGADTGIAASQDENTETESDSATPARKKVTQAESMSTEVEKRPKKKPKSILARLQGLLRDVKEAVLGPQEEREIDEVLFQLRKEVHEAERRGREAMESG